MTTLTTPPPLPGEDDRDAAKPAVLDKPQRTIGSAKWVWAIGGAVLGQASALSDFMFAWRGSRLPPWSGPGLWYNLRLLAFSTFVFAVIAFIIGASNDRVRSRPVVQRAYRFTNFIARNWRGEFPLWMSFWLFGFFGTVFTSVVTYVTTEALLGDAGYDPRAVWQAWSRCGSASWWFRRGSSSASGGPPIGTSANVHGRASRPAGRAQQKSPSCSASLTSYFSSSSIRCRRSSTCTARRSQPIDLGGGTMPRLSPLG